MTILSDINNLIEEGERTQAVKDTVRGFLHGASAVVNPLYHKASTIEHAKMHPTHFTGVENPSDARALAAVVGNKIAQKAVDIALPVGGLATYHHTKEKAKEKAGLKNK